MPMTAGEVSTPVTIRPQQRPRLRFDRNELAGAFGDIGTDLPLVIGMIVASGLNSASVLVMFGLMQLLTAFVYGMPMAVQPLKAVAVIVITQHIAPGVLYGGGLAIGIAMMILTVTGGIDWLSRVVPLAVVRGLQLGLGLQLSLLALGNYVQRDGTSGYVLAAVAFVIVIALMGNRRFPPALFVIALGVVYAFAFKLNTSAIAGSVGFSLPQVQRLSLSDIMSGFVLLAIPQIPLSLGNSILATRQIAEDLFPESADRSAQAQSHLRRDEPGQSLARRSSHVSRIRRPRRAVHLRRAHRRIADHLWIDLSGPWAVLRFRLPASGSGLSASGSRRSAAVRGNCADAADSRRGGEQK